MAIRFAPKPRTTSKTEAVAKAPLETADRPARKRKPGGGRKPSSDPKEVVTLRLPRSEVARWKAKGENWRALMEERLRG